MKQESHLFIVLFRYFCWQMIKLEIPWKFDKLLKTWNFLFSVSRKALLHFLLLCKKCDNNHDVDTTKLRILIKIKVYLDYEKQNCFLTYNNEKKSRYLNSIKATKIEEKWIDYRIFCSFFQIRTKWNMNRVDSIQWCQKLRKIKTQTTFDLRSNVKKFLDSKRLPFKRRYHV